MAVNEPTVAWPTLREVARAAAQAGMPLGVLTNGYMQPEIADEMGALRRRVAPCGHARHPERGGRGPVKIGLIDVGEWQTTVDFRTGATVVTADPLGEMGRGLLSAHPYPSDMVPHACRWVTDTALDVYARYAPPFVLLVYANGFSPAVLRPTDEADCAAQRQEVFDEAARFLAETGSAPGTTPASCPTGAAPRRSRGHL